MKSTSMVRLALVVLPLAAAPLPAQAPQDVTVEWIFSDKADAAVRMPKFAWTASDELLLLDESKPPGERTIERVRAGTGERKAAVDAAAALASLKALSPSGTLPDSLGWPESLDDAGKTGLYLFGDDLFALDLAASRFTRLTRTDAKELLPRISPDGSKAAFVRGNDLYVIDLASGKETRLTSDGSETILNGTLSWLYWEEIFSRGDTGYWWSPDSSAIAYLRSDESPVDVAIFTDIAPAVPRQIRQRYPQTGGANPIVRLGIADLATAKTSWLDASVVPYEYVIGALWLPDNRRIAVETMNRAQTKLDVWLVDRTGGRATKALTENDPNLVDQKEIVFLDGGKKMLVSSESGRAHAPLPLRDRRRSRERRHEGPLVRARPGSGFYGAPLGFGVGRRGARRRLLHGDREVFRSSTTSTRSARRHRHGAHDEGRRTARDRVLPGPPFLRGHLLEPRHPRPRSRSTTRPGRNARVARRQPHGRASRRLPSRRGRSLTIPAADGFALPTSLFKPRDFDAVEEVPDPRPRVRRPRRADRPGLAGIADAFFDQVLAHAADTSSPRSTRAAPRARARRSRTSSSGR